VSTVRLQSVSKRFAETPVVHDVSLDVGEGELVALLGPSGSGKTTLLRLIAGFERPDGGRVFIGGEDVTDVDALRRRCGMVFQHYALFPHMSVAENVAYGLANEKLDRNATAARVAEALALVDLAGLENRAVTALSGGQQQRVALARALAPRPSVLLLDEPLSNLDPSLRERTRRELRELIDRIGITTVLVTHEQEEAFALADRVALLMKGVLAQVGPPEDLYLRPASSSVATFVGRATRVAGRKVDVSGDQVTVAVLGQEFSVPGANLAAETAGAEVDVLFRPEALTIDDAGAITGTVLRRRFTGAADLLTIAIGEVEVEVAATPERVSPGDQVRLTATGSGIHAYPRARSA
jgi:ABC-type Fe3+/spermidine/putrescine transport system ATPase subunit